MNKGYFANLVAKVIGSFPSEYVRFYQLQQQEARKTKEAWRDKKVEEGKDGDGRAAKHQCRDVPCLVLFVLCQVLAIFLFVYAWRNGNSALLTSGYDVSGNICGRADNVDLGDRVPYSGMNMEDRP